MQISKSHRPAFSLIELLIVISIMAISLTIALPATHRYLRWSQQNRTITLVSNLLQQAQLTALQQGTTCWLRWNQSSKRMEIHMLQAEPLVHKNDSRVDKNSFDSVHLADVNDIRFDSKLHSHSMEVIPIYCDGQVAPARIVVQLDKDEVVMETHRHLGVVSSTVNRTKSAK